MINSLGIQTSERVALLKNDAWQFRYYGIYEKLFMRKIWKDKIKRALSSWPVSNANPLFHKNHLELQPSTTQLVHPPTLQHIHLIPVFTIFCDQVSTQVSHSSCSLILNISRFSPQLVLLHILLQHLFRQSSPSSFFIQQSSSFSAKSTVKHFSVKIYSFACSDQLLLKLVEY